MALQDLGLIGKFNLLHNVLAWIEVLPIIRKTCVFDAFYFCIVFCEVLKCAFITFKIIIHVTSYV